MYVFHHLPVLGHHQRRVVMVILEAAVSAALQEQPDRVDLIPSTGAVERCVPTVRLAVGVTAALQQRDGATRQVTREGRVEGEA